MACSRIYVQYLPIALALGVSCMQHFSTSQKLKQHGVPEFPHFQLTNLLSKSPICSKPKRVVFGIPTRSSIEWDLMFEWDDGSDGSDGDGGQASPMSWKRVMKTFQRSWLSVAKHSKYSPKTGPIQSWTAPRKVLRVMIISPATALYTI